MAAARGRPRGARSPARYGPRARERWPVPMGRLMYGCAIIQDIHQASIETLTNPKWAPHDVPLLWLQLPGGTTPSMISFRLKVQVLESLLVQS